MRHPQAAKTTVVEVRHPWAFTCAGCGEEFYLYSAFVGEDGSLRCYSCSPDDEPTLSWCAGCERALPFEAFTLTTEGVDPDILAIRQGFGITEAIECRECADRTPAVRPCQHCGEPIPATMRADARYCSGRCRVAALRSRRE